MNKKVKICLNTMVSNESHIVKRMLESCYKYIDYWIIQDNGSTDGTQDLIRNFFKEKGIDGILYEIPWKFPGYNRDHALQTTLQHQHGCDWILRIDADEVLIIEKDFDWSILNNLSIQSFNITARQGNCTYHRCWLWNASLPWKFKHDKRHEIIYLDKNNVGENFQRITLPSSFRHEIFGDGQTWHNPYKFYADGLEIEKDLLLEKTMKEDIYHLFYIAKSYRDSVLDPRSKWPFGEDHAKECARRAIFFFGQYLNLTHDYANKKHPQRIDEMGYMVMIFIADCYFKLGDEAIAIDYLEKSEPFCPERNEHLLELSQIYLNHGEKDKLLKTVKTLIDTDRRNPFPKYCFFINNEAYYDTGKSVQHLYNLVGSLSNILNAV